MTAHDPDALHGPWHIGWPEDRPPFVALIDPSSSDYPEAQTLLTHARASYVLEARPSIAEATAVVELLVESDVRRLVSIGAGLVIDTGKLAAYYHRERTNELLEHCAVPCGPELYRAVTPFSMYEGTPGTRDAVWEDWLRPNEVALAPELLSRMDSETVQLFAGDSLVHVIESLLSKLGTSKSKAYALAAAQTFATAADVSAPDRVALAVASMNAARAFDITKLGLAHALSRPLGIAAGTSHDAFNLMLGAAVISFWGSTVIADSPLRLIASVDPTVSAWSRLVDGYRQRAGLPAALSAAGITPKDVDAALAWAPNSSGIPNLPHPVEAGDLERIIEAAWEGRAVSRSDKIVST